MQARGALGPLLRARIGRGDFHPGRLGELLDRVHERQAARVGQEADRVAMRAAAEAMVEALVVVDGEARRLLLMERAARLPLAPGADQLHLPPIRRRQRRSGARSSSRNGGERLTLVPADFAAMRRLSTGSRSSAAFTRPLALLMSSAAVAFF